MRVIMFGSYLTDKINSHDIDLAIITRIRRSSKLGMFIVNRLRKHYASKYNKTIHISIYTPQILDDISKSDLVDSRGRNRKDVIKAINGGLRIL